MKMRMRTTTITNQSTRHIIIKDTKRDKLKPCLRSMQSRSTEDSEPVAYLPISNLRKPWNSKQGANHRRHVLNRLANTVEALENLSSGTEMASLDKDRTNKVIFESKPRIYNYEHSDGQVQAMFGEEYDITRYGTPTSKLVINENEQKESVAVVVDNTLGLKQRLRHNKSI